MCGRFSFVASKEKISKQIGFSIPEEIEGSYNVAPMQQVYVITNDAPRRLLRMHWGLVPHWAKDSRTGANLINARSEGIAGKPSFRIPIRKKRCLVPADSFYEWRREGARRIPFRVMLKDSSLMMFAGVWDEWEGENGEVLRTFAIVTTAPNLEMSRLHDRMPVLLQQPAQQREWLESSRLDLILSLLQTPEDGILNIYPVSDKVNSVGNNSNELHTQVELPPNLF